MDSSLVESIFFINFFEVRKMNQSDLMKLGIALGICYGAYRFAPNQLVKAAVIGVAGVIVAKKVPYVSAYV